MNTCAVTIAGPDRRVDLVVSTETPISDLIPTFVELSMDEAPVENGRAPVWTVAPPGQQPLPLDRTLAQCGIADGAVLSLTELRRSEEHTSELQSLRHLVCRLLLEKKKKKNTN